MAEVIFKRGWLKEQLEKAAKDVSEWPQWMKDAWKKDQRFGPVKKLAPA